MLEKYLNDRVTLVKADGTVAREEIRAMVQPKTIFMADESLPIEPGDHLLHALPSGLVADYIVDEPGFYNVSVGDSKPHFQTKVHRSGAASKEAQTIINNIQGDNARVNVHSTDNSANFVFKIEESQIFGELKALLNASKIPPQEAREIRGAIEDMEKSTTRQGFISGYQNFMQKAANHITVFAPLLTTLSRMLS